VVHRVGCIDERRPFARAEHVGGRDDASVVESNRLAFLQAAEERPLGDAEFGAHVRDRSGRASFFLNCECETRREWRSGAASMMYSSSRTTQPGARCSLSRKFRPEVNVAHERIEKKATIAEAHKYREASAWSRSVSVISSP